MLRDFFGSTFVMLFVVAILLAIASWIWGRPPKRDAKPASSRPTPESARYHRGCPATDGLLPLVADDALSTQLLAPWSWLAGEDALLVAATVFGDPIVRQADGRFALIDTTRGVLVPLAASTSAETLRADAEVSTRLRESLLREIASSGRDLPPDCVFDWIESPALGGTETLDNLQMLSLRVHLATTAAMHRAVRDARN